MNLRVHVVLNVPPRYLFIGTYRGGFLHKWKTPDSSNVDKIIIDRNENKISIVHKIWKKIDL
jgi:hypothetical protein